MFDFLDLIPALKQLLKTVTWVKIAQVTVLFLVFFSAWLTYATRDTIVTYITHRTSKPSITSQAEVFDSVSQTTKNNISAIVNNSSIINAISIEIFNFNMNSRYTAYMYTDDQQLGNIYLSQHYGLTGDPIFRNSTMYNKRLISLINGEFVCDKYINTDESIDMPDIAPLVKYVCSGGIPPYYGKIIGILNIYLRAQPTDNDIDQLRIAAQTLSTEIYDKDVGHAN